MRNNESNWKNYPENKPNTCNVLKYSDDHILRVRVGPNGGFDNMIADYREEYGKSEAGWYTQSGNKIRDDAVISFCRIPE